MRYVIMELKNTRDKIHPACEKIRKEFDRAIDILETTPKRLEMILFNCEQNFNSTNIKIIKDLLIKFGDKNE